MRSSTKPTATRQLESESEPWPQESELCYDGEEAIIAVGFTSSGFPYGSTRSESRESMAPETGGDLGAAAARADDDLRGLDRR